MSTIKSVHGHAVARQVREDVFRVMAIDGATFDDLHRATRDLVIAYEGGKLRAKHSANAHR